MPFFKKPYSKYVSQPPAQKKFGGSNVASYRVRSPIRSFRDLDVYKQTTFLASEIAKFKFPKKAANLEKEHDILKEISKQIPRFIAESYGDKFTDIKRATGKLETAMRGVTNAVAKLDFMIMYLEADSDIAAIEDPLPPSSNPDSDIAAIKDSPAPSGEKNKNENSKIEKETNEERKETEEKEAVARQFRDWQKSKGENEDKKWVKETEEKEAVARQFRDWLQKYQIQRFKILNLKRSWDRVFNRFGKG